MVWVLAFWVLLGGVQADLYLHSPRGSNNRLNEKSANRNNGDRLFDSQNNNRGGYNVGDRTDNPSTQYLPPSQTFDINDPSGAQYQMVFFERSVLTFEWTNQHGCGGNEETDPQKLNCNINLQYMCEIDYPDIPDGHMNVRLRDGANTNTPDKANNFDEIQATTDANAANGRGTHESVAWYYMCEKRNRNQGLFHADQNLNGDSTKYTRQNPNGNRRGLECPEERDYYPYWNPTPWRDLAILTDHSQNCETLVEQSQNTASVGFCKGLLEEDETVPITEAECDEAGGTWAQFSHNLARKPICAQVGWSRTNHLGNGRDAVPLSINLTLPDLDELKDNKPTELASGFYKCVARIRYNMTTDDYRSDANSTMDDDEDNGFYSPVRQNPTVDVGASMLQGLKLAVNTAQFGRTFQDRTHVFYIKARPTNDPVFEGDIYNLNVRGKRCNIVQCFPAVEYDFVPKDLWIPASGAAIHVQWTGSNTHNNGNPAGDGQAGDAGEGTGGTDRQNMVLISNDRRHNYPIPLDKFADVALWPKMDFWRPITGEAISDWVDAAVILATSGQYTDKNDPELADFQELLNDSPASLIGGILMAPKAGSIFQDGPGSTPHKFSYMNTRNNNFSNRSQKAWITIGGPNSRPVGQVPGFEAPPQEAN